MATNFPWPSLLSLSALFSWVVAPSLSTTSGLLAAERADSHRSPGVRQVCLASAYKNEMAFAAAAQLFARFRVCLQVASQHWGYRNSRIFLTFLYENLAPVESDRKSVVQGNSVD